MSYALQDIRRTPLSRLTIEQTFILELHKFMVDLRLAANEERLRKYKNPAHLNYLVGRIHGLVFGLASQLIYRDSYFDHPAGDARDAAFAEADFLTNAYQHPEWQQ
jgi:hypothetical protein